MLNVTVWSENIQEKEEAVQKVYPNGITGQIASFLKSTELNVRTATLDQPECGLSDEVLNHTDVLLWWAHVGHDLIPDELAKKVTDRVLAGMGLIVLHSAHYSKPFTRLMGTTCSLRWRDGGYERVWNVSPGHPIAEGIPAAFELLHEEMYGEFFDIPEPDELVFLGWFRSGEVFRSGCCWKRGYGKVFYFQPGHETDGAYYNPTVQKLLQNAVRWAAPSLWRKNLGCIHEEAVETKIVNGKSIQEY